MYVHTRTCIYMYMYTLIHDKALIGVGMKLQSEAVIIIIPQGSGEYYEQ
jgi:hypothetical protein